MAWRCAEEDSPHPTLLVSLTVDELVRVKALGQENRLLHLYLMRHRHNIYVLIHNTHTHIYRQMHTYAYTVTQYTHTYIQLVTHTLHYHINT